MDHNSNSGFEEDQKHDKPEFNIDTHNNMGQRPTVSCHPTGCARKQKTSETFTESMKNLQLEKPSSDTDEDQENNLFASRMLLQDLQSGSLTLDRLPCEILLYICQFLDAKEIVKNLSKVCTVFQELFSSETYWKTRLCKRWPKQYPPVYQENFDWHLACVEREEQHHVWKNVDETCVHIKCREGVYAPVDAVHLMKNGTLLASGSRDRYLNLIDLTKYDCNDPKSVKKMNIHSDDKAHKGWIWSLASFDDTLISGSWDTYIKMWDLNNQCRETAKFKCTSAVLGLHAETNFIVGAGYNRYLFMVDPRQDQASVVKQKFHRRPVLCVAADCNYIISGSEDKTLAVYDRRAARLLKTIQMENYAMDLSFGHNQLWVGDKAGGIHLFDTTHGSFEPIQTCNVGHTGKVTGIIYTLGALFTCSTDKTIKVMEPNCNPSVIATVGTHNGEVARISYQNGVLASAGSDVSVEVYIPKTLYNTFHIPS